MVSVFRHIGTLVVSFVLWVSSAGCHGEHGDHLVQIAVLETSVGVIQVKYFPASAPLAVENFRGHVRSGYFDGTTFHRIIPGFIIQGGDPTGTGAGGQSIWGGPFADEFDPALRYDRPGLLGMVNTGPDTNRSQFFIALRDMPWLNDRHTIFGEVILGTEVLQAIEDLGTSSGMPSQDVYLLRAFELTIEAVY